MVMTFFTSYGFELVGRKWTIFLSFFFTSLVFIYIPYTAPCYTKLVICRCAIGITMAAPISHPLIPDYIVKKSRGKAIALMGVGVVFGEVFSMGVLFNLTKSMSFENAFLLSGLFILALSFVYLLIIKDPDMKNLRRGINEKMTYNK